ncbi:MAG: ribosomal L7Ae/L30e/S12e/Gadd45 family protein [Clostridium sp.]
MNKFFNFLGLAKRAGSIVEGYSKCDEQRNRKQLQLFIISKDASSTTRKKFVNHCNEKKIPYIEGISKEELGMAIGREEVNVMAIEDKNMAKKLLSLYEEENQCMK